MNFWRRKKLEKKEKQKTIKILVSFFYLFFLSAKIFKLSKYTIPFSTDVYKEKQKTIKILVSFFYVLTLPILKLSKDKSISTYVYNKNTKNGQQLQNERMKEELYSSDHGDVS